MFSVIQTVEIFNITHKIFKKMAEEQSMEYWENVTAESMSSGNLSLSENRLPTRSTT